MSEKGLLNQIKSAPFKPARTFLAIFLIAAFVSGVLPPGSSLAYANSNPLAESLSSSAPFLIPPQLGRVEESFRGNSGKTILFIQDAHDSLEAQIHIARLVRYGVQNHHIQTVFEEGYEGRVPSDHYFGFIRDKKIRQRVSFFLMDKLRLGGAEYAHINRDKDFKLIGIDRFKLYDQNVRAYQEHAKNAGQADRDLEAILGQLNGLANRFFPRPLKSWLKGNTRFNAGNLSLTDYVLQLQSLREQGLRPGFGKTFAEAYPVLHLLTAAHQTQSVSALEKLQHLNLLALHRELVKLEEESASGFLRHARERNIWTYLRHAALLKRLNQMELTHSEYQAVKPLIGSVRTAEMAAFIAKTAGRSLLLSKNWEKQILNAAEFYEVAELRDQAMEGPLRDFIRNPDEKTAILVFGGFHAQGIQTILRRHGISFHVIVPAISRISPRHQAYYKQLMAVGHHDFEMPFMAARANRPPSEFFLAHQFGQAPVMRKIKSIVKAAQPRPEFRQAVPLSEAPETLDSWRSPAKATWTIWKKLGFSENRIFELAPLAESLIVILVYNMFVFLTPGLVESHLLYFVSALISNAIFAVLHWDGVYVPRRSGPPVFKRYFNWKQRVLVWAKLFAVGAFLHVPFYILLGYTAMTISVFSFMLGVLSTAWMVIGHQIYSVSGYFKFFRKWPALMLPQEASLEYKLTHLARHPNSGITEEIKQRILEDVHAGRLPLAHEDLNVIEFDENGRVQVIGQLDARIVHRYRILHQSSNVVPISSSGTLFLQRRVHNKVRPLELTLFGGHAGFGETAIETAQNELKEESGLGKSWKFEGTWKVLGAEHGFASKSLDPPNNERVTNVIYFSSDHESRKIRRYGARLDEIKRSMTRAQYMKWLEERQLQQHGEGETWSVYEVELEDLLKFVESKKRQKESGPREPADVYKITKTDIFKDGAFTTDLEITADVLEPLLQNEEAVEELKRAVAAARIDKKKIEEDLKNIRQLFHEQKFEEAKPKIAAVLNDIRVVLAVGSEADSPFISYLYMAQVMEKFAKGGKPSTGAARKVTARQIMVVDSSGKRVLLQKRGAYKRLFAGKYTVSANAKAPGKDKPMEGAVKAVKEEIGLSVSEDRFQEVPLAGTVGRFASRDFYALSDSESQALQLFYQVNRDLYRQSGVEMEWNEEKRSLCVYSISADPGILARLQENAQTIRDMAGVPWIYPVLDENHGSLLVLRVTEQEELQINQTADAARSKKEKAQSQRSSKGTPDIFKALDSDEMGWMPRQEVEERFAASPADFALDLVEPHFKNPQTWEMLFPSLISADDEAAASVAVSGGKGANTHFLRTLMKTEKIPGLRIPETSIVTTHAFERIVLADPAIRKLLSDLQKTNQELEIKKLCQQIRDRIMEIPFPPSLTEQIAREVSRLGAVAVRSSATVEDLKNFAGAGLAKSRLHQTSLEQVLFSIKEVWASLYDDGFVTHRREAGLSVSKASMAVLLQQFVEPRASGTVLSIDANNRPVIQIGAGLGIGEGVVDGKLPTDTWLVGFLADSILERNVKHKTGMVTLNPEGGTRTVLIESDEPSLSDPELLETARLVKLIRRHYVASGRAEHVDVEFAIDKKTGLIYVVQTRARQVSQVSVKNQAEFIVKTVDEARAGNLGQVRLDPKGYVAERGAVTAKLQILRGQSAGDERRDRHLASLVEPGVILVAHHTNNDFNDVFAKLAGVITTDGGPTSHAALNSAPLKIPCLVGTADAMEKLAEYDGRVVTLDSSRQKIYLGTAPITEVTLQLGIWDSDEVQGEEQALANVEPHEIFERWGPLEKKRREVYKTFPEDGHLRRRSNAYRWFQIDYYWKAWDRLTQEFERLLGDRAPWPLATQDRVIKPDHRRLSFHPDAPADPPRMALYQRLTRNDPRSIYYFVKYSTHLSDEDLRSLFAARWNGLRQFAERMRDVQSINADNVERVVDALIDAFLWMHIGFWLDVLVNHLSAVDQIRYVHKDFRALAMDAASRAQRIAENIAPDRDDVPDGYVLKLSRRKDRELYAVVERIWSRKDLSRIFESQNDEEVIARELAAAAPDILETIDSWSMRYKHTSEHLDHLSDTLAYVRDIRGRILEGTSLTFDNIVEGGCFPLLRETGAEKVSAAFLREHDPNLYLVVRGYARAHSPAAHKPWLVGADDLSDEALDAGVIQDINRRIKKVEEPKLATVQDALGRYPNLSQTMALRNIEFLLREDGHHLIVPHQRRISRMMASAAEPFTGILGTPQAVFDISTDEFVGLLQDPDPSYIAETPARNRLYVGYETQLSAALKPSADSGSNGNNHEAQRTEAAVEAYAANVKNLLEILQRQENASRVERTKRHYREERERLTQRVENLRDTVRMLKMKELLNHRDVPRGQFKAHVMMVCGNDFLDNFQEAVELYAANRVQKVLISGGFGKGTLPLIQNALLESIPVHISDTEVIMHESQLQRLYALHEQGRLGEALKRSEADIIKEIILHMAQNRKSAQGNPSPISIDPNDIILEAQTSNIVEYFNRTKVILRELHEQMGLGNDPIVVGYMHDPVVQFRTKGTFDRSYNNEVLDSKIHGVSYSLDYDIHALDRNTVKLAMIREMWGLLLFTRAGHVQPSFHSQPGLEAIPAAYWETASELAAQFPDPKGLREFVSNMYEGYKKQNPEFAPIQQILSEAPETARSFTSVLQRVLLEPASGETAPALRSELRQIAAEPAASFLRSADRSILDRMTGMRSGVIFIDAEDFPSFSDEQKNEFFTLMLSAPKLKMIIYNERGQVEDENLAALIKLPHVVRTDKPWASVGIFDVPSSVSSVHLSKKVLLSRTARFKSSGKVSFFRTHGDKAGTLTAALLWTQSQNEGAEFGGVRQDPDGFWTVEDSVLEYLQVQFQTEFAVAIAA